MKNFCLYTAVNDTFIDGALVMLYSFLKNNSWFDGDIIVGYGKEEGCQLSYENREKIANLYYKIKFIEKGTIEIDGEDKKILSLLADFNGAAIELVAKVKDEEELSEPTSDEE